jgi:predicted GIY-YIG superfamily endonuclease
LLTISNNQIILFTVIEGGVIPMFTRKKTIIAEKPAIRHSKAWDSKDKEATQFFVYILKLDNGHFYIGQSRELRERLSEHKDGKTFSTRGLNPKLQYFEILSSRELVEKREFELKQICSQNEREIRRMILDFKDLTNELDYA